MAKRIDLHGSTTRAMLIAACVVVAGCDNDKKSLLAPTNSTILITSSAPIVAANGTLLISIAVTRSNGEPVADGTEIAVTTSLGQLDQAKLRTRAGTASVGFRAQTQAGVAKIQASSADTLAVLDIPITSAAIERIRLTVNPATLPPAGGDSDLTATVLGSGDVPVAGAPVTFVVSEGKVTPATAVMSDSAGIARAKLTGQSAVKVTARVHQITSQEVEVALRVQVALRVRVSPSDPMEDDTVTFTITPTEIAPGTVELAFGDGKTKSLGQLTNSLSATHQYTAPGGYNASAVFKGADNEEVSETIRVNVRQKPAPPPPNTPTPNPSPTPTPPPVPNPPNSPLDLSTVRWLHTDVSAWKESSQLTNVSINSSGTCLYHSMSGKWPPLNGLEGNVWIFAQINGTWYAATWEYLKPGQTCKAAGTASQIGPHTEAPPLENWRPRSGEQVGFMVSTKARYGTGSLKERSNVVLVRWP